MLCAVYLALVCGYIHCGGLKLFESKAMGLAEELPLPRNAARHTGPPAIRASTKRVEPEVAGWVVDWWTGAGGRVEAEAEVQVETVES